jgi:hypothetical protein
LPDTASGNAIGDEEQNTNKEEKAMFNSSNDASFDVKVRSLFVNGQEIVVQQKFQWIDRVGGQKEPMGHPFVHLSDGCGNTWDSPAASAKELLLMPEERFGQLFYPEWDMESASFSGRGTTLCQFIDQCRSLGRYIYS